MNTIQAYLIGEDALLARADLEQLLEIARRSEPVELQWQSDDLPTADIMRLVEQGGAFQFWREPGEEIYSINDGEPTKLN